MRSHIQRRQTCSETTWTLNDQDSLITMEKLSLVMTRDRMAVCRLSPDAALPSFFTNPPTALPTSCLASCTRTPHELSLVCPQIWLPNDSSSTESSDMRVESDWICLQVEGPLDFSLTGILARLTAPLAQHSISIFAMSSYDTDYLLVKHDKIDQAIRVLEQETQQCTVTVLPAQGGSNGQATAFVADTLVAPLKHEPPSSWPRTFGLVLVAGWPPPEAVRQQYEHEIVPIIQQCFDPSDWKESAYIYPASALHSTVATLYTFLPEKQINPNLTLQEQQHLIQHAKSVVQQAVEDWTNQPSLQSKINIELELHSLQLGQKALILLWKDASGQLRKLRQCISNAIASIDVETSKTTNNEDEALRSLLVRGLSIPDIVHTSILRFAHSPNEDGKVIQQRFQEAMMHRGKLKVRWPVESISLVNEQKAYMHLPDDDEHVLYQYRL